MRRKYGYAEICVSVYPYFRVRQGSLVIELVNELNQQLGHGLAGHGRMCLQAGEGVGEVDGADGLADATLGVDNADDGAPGFPNLFLCIYSSAEKQKSVYEDFNISLFLYRFSPCQDLTEGASESQ